MLKKAVSSNFNLRQQLVQQGKCAAATTGGGHEHSLPGHMAYKHARPFAELPGPTLFSLVLGFLPGGPYRKKTAPELVSVLRQQYGDIFKMPQPFKNPIVMVFDPDMYRLVFRNEGVWPMRQNFETMEYHRRVHQKEFFAGVEGILMSSGEDWSRFRTAVNPILLQPKNARLYINKMLEVNKEFLLRIREIRDPATNEVPNTFEDEINRLAFESISVIALDKQLGLIRRDRDHPEATKLFRCLRVILDLAYEIEMSPISWKLIKTPKFKRLMRVADELVEVLTKYINDALAEIASSSHGSRGYEERSVVEKLLKIDKRIAITMAMDLLMAGVDTTSTTIAGLLLAVAKNPEKQEKLRKEMRTLLPEKNSRLTIQNMQNLPYLRACIKEAIRLYPVIPGTTRILSTDLALGGYQIPKGHGITIGSNLLVRDEKYFPKPNEFIPERWLRSPGADDEILTPDVSNPFVYLPFGFGPRSCAGQRIAEMELEITLSTLVRNFYIEYNYPAEKPFKGTFMNVPAIPLKFTFKEVED